MEQGKSRLAFDIETSFLQPGARVKQGFQLFISREHFQVIPTIRAHILLIRGVYSVFEFKLNFGKVVALVPESMVLLISNWILHKQSLNLPTSYPPYHPLLELGVGSVGDGEGWVGTFIFVCAFCPPPPSSPPPTPSAPSPASVFRPLLSNFSLKSNLIFSF